MNIFIFLLGLFVVILFWVIGLYNFFVSSKARIKASIQEIGNQLKRQAELIPNLEASVKGYLKHEKGIFEMLTKARKQIAGAIESNDISKMSKASSAISEILPKLTIAVEDNPEIKADGVVTRLMDELRDTSDKVMYARRLMIDLTADYNVKRVTVPSNFVASMFGFTELRGFETPEEGEHLSLSSAETKTPKVNL